MQELKSLTDKIKQSLADRQVWRGEPPCSRCNGTGTEIIEGKGARDCRHEPVTASPNTTNQEAHDQRAA